MPAQARLGDPISCGDTIAQGSGNVFANGMPTTRINSDLTAGHCFPPVPIISGSPNVFANNIAVARVSDPIQVHCCGSSCHSGSVANGSPNVFVNSSGASTTVISPSTAASLAKQYDEVKQPSATHYISAIHNADDEGAPSDVGGDVPYSTHQAYVAGSAAAESIDIATPPTTDATAAVSAAPPVTNSAYNYTDIDAATLFPVTFQLSPNFTLGQLTTQCAVSNYVLREQVTAGQTYTTKDIVKNLRDLCYNILEPLLSTYGGMTINSGFRHTKNGKSQHERGQAADVAFAGMGTNAAAAFTRAQDIANSTLPYDQFIFEQNNTIWFHLSYDRTKIAQRRDVRTKPRGIDSPQAGLFKVVA